MASGTNFLGIGQEMARQIIEDELAMYKANRYRLTLRLTIFNRVKAHEDQIRALTEELEKLEQVILAYEQELAATN